MKRLGALGVLVGLALAASVTAQEPPAERGLAPGVTVWVYDIGERLERRPTIAEGQTPNIYEVRPVVQLEGEFRSPGAELKEMFAGEVHGWLSVDQPGQYRLRLDCDDGAALVLDNKTVLDTALAEGFKAEGRVELAKGLHKLSIPFYQDKGKFSLKLWWGRPDGSALETVPGAALFTEAGQTFATSPGPKRWFYGNDPNRPGDGRPLETVHPGYTLENFRGPEFQPAVGGLAFLPDGRLAVCTWDHVGAVYILGNLDGKQPGGVTVRRFAEGLGEPLGIAVIDGDIYVSQKQEVTRLRDTDGDGVADRYEAVAGGWPASHNYHEFPFNLAHLDGSFFVSTSVPLKSGLTNYTPGSRQAYAVPDVPGSVLRINPKAGTWEVFARGMRAPNGMNVCTDGELFCCDNQGGWLPASRLDLVHRGGFYGHQYEPNGETPVDPPVVWFPHGEIGNSPTQPVLVADGLYRRQILVGDVTHGGINRVFVENVGGEYQGAVFQFSQGIEAGVNRLAWGPDGCLYVGGIGSNGNWNHKNTKFGLQRLRPNGRTAFEMKSVESRADGFLISLTRPVPESILTDPASYLVRSWRYKPTADYGGPKVDLKTLEFAHPAPSPDRQRVFVPIGGLEPGTVVYLRLRGFKDDAGEEPFATEVWYTLNRLAAQAGPAFDYPMKHIDLPGTPPGGAVVLFDGTDAAAFTHADGSSVRWRVEHGELVVDQKAGDIVSRESFGDCFLHVEWLSPPGGTLVDQHNGNSGVKLQCRYELQIMNNPGWPREPKFDEAGAIYRLRAADVNASTGAGTWQSYDERFRAPRWRGDTKTASARMTVWWNGVLVHDDAEVAQQTGVSEKEAPGERPLLLQAHPSEAEGDVRFRNVWVVREGTDG